MLLKWKVVFISIGHCLQVIDFHVCEAQEDRAIDDAAGTNENR